MRCMSPGGGCFSAERSFLRNGEGRLRSTPASGRALVVGGPIVVVVVRVAGCGKVAMPARQVRR